MLKIVSAALATTVLVAGLGITAADAKGKHKAKKPKAEASTSCMTSASPLMRDEHKYSTCFMGMQQSKK
jgi:hypothetical protein